MSVKKNLLAICFLLSIFPFLIGSSATYNYDDEKNFFIYCHSVYLKGSEVKVELSASSKLNSFNFRLLKINKPDDFIKNYYNYYNSTFDIINWDGQNLLDNTKLIKEWNYNISEIKEDWHHKIIDVGKIEDDGIYLVQAISLDKVTYCLIIVSDYTLVYKTTDKQILAFISNSRTGKIETNTQFELFNLDTSSIKIKSDKDGIAFLNNLNQKSLSYYSSFIIGYINDEVIFDYSYLYFPRNFNQLKGYIYTNQPVYRPGQTVNFKAIIRKQIGNELINLEKEEFRISIKSPKNKEVFSSVSNTNEFGTLSGSFKLDDEADIGPYTILISNNNNSMYGNFSVEEYKKPEYKVSIKTAKNNYKFNDTLKGEVSAEYYFGSKVKEGKVLLRISKIRYWIPWWYWSEYAWFYKNYNNHNYNYGSEQELEHIEGKLDKNGNFSFSYPIIKDKENDFDYSYILDAEVTDNSRNVVSGNKKVFVTRGDFNLTASTDKYYVQVNNPIKLKIKSIDFDANPIQTEIKLIINKVNWIKEKKYEETIITFKERTDIYGKVEFVFTPAEKGYYNFTAIANDENKNQIAVSGNFFATDGNNDFYKFNNNSIEILTDKDAYKKGDTLTALIFFPEKNFDALITYEANTIIEYKKYFVKENSLEIKIVLTDNFAPNFYLSICFVKNGTLHTQSKMVGVLPTEKFLNVSIIPSKNEFKPGEKADYKILVKDKNGFPSRNTEISLGLTDESVYAIKNESKQNINDFFFSPLYNYVRIKSSQFINYNSFPSRKITEFEKSFITDKSIIQKSKKKAKVFGKIKFPAYSINKNHIRVYLLNNENIFYSELNEDTLFIFNSIPFGDYDLLIKSKAGYIFPHKKVVIKKYFVDLCEFDIEYLHSIVSNLSGIISTTSMRSTNDAVLLSEGVKIKKSEELENNDKYVQAVVRENYSDAPFWIPSFVTDENGEAKLSFNLPDNLTTWRATAVAVTKDSKFGQNINLVIARKNLLVRIEAPRFFREDDKIIISTIVHNYLNEKKKIKISFNVKGLKIVGSTSDNSKKIISKINNKAYEIIIDKNSEQRIDWEVEVNSPIGEAELFAQALTNEESDAAKIKIPILPKGIKQILPLNAELQNETEKIIPFNIPAKTDLRTVKLSFSINPSIAAALLKSLDDLIAYPYGCVEQTMSRFLPALIVANTYKELKIPLIEKSLKELPQVVDVGLKRLYSFQHNDGGWGWWKEDNTHPFMTAYVVYGLSLAKSVGYQINETIYNNGLNNLIHQIKNEKKIDNTTLAYMVYSASTALKIQKNDDNGLLKIADKLFKEELNTYSLSLLGLTYNNFNFKNYSSLEKNNLKQIQNKLLSTVVSENNFAFWGGKSWHYNWQDDKIQSTAFAVKFLISTGENSDLISKSVSWLLKNQRGYSWNSTQETAAVIFALTDYLKITSELEPNFSVSILLNGVEVGRKNFNSSNLFEDGNKISINAIDNELLKLGENKIVIRKNGKGKLYFSGYEQHFDKTDLSANKNDFIIKKEFFKLIPKMTSEGIIYRKEIINSEVTSGDNIFVKIYFDSKSALREYLMLEDMFPSGFEIIKDEEKYNIEGESNFKNERRIYRPWRLNYANREIRDEKISFFVTFANSNLEFSYLLRAQAPGKFNIMPAEAYLMYYPEVFGSSDGSSIIVTENFNK